MSPVSRLIEGARLTRVAFLQSDPNPLAEPLAAAGRHGDLADETRSLIAPVEVDSPGARSMRELSASRRIATTAIQATKHVVELRGSHRLGEIVVAAGVQAAFAVPRHGVRRQGDDRDVAAGGPLGRADTGGRL